MWNQQLVLLQLLAVTWIRYISAQVAIEFTDAEIEELVDAHNLFRGLVDPPASNMQQVVRSNNKLVAGLVCRKFICNRTGTCSCVSLLSAIHKAFRCMYFFL